MNNIILNDDIVCFNNKISYDIYQEYSNKYNLFNIHYYLYSQDVDNKSQEHIVNTKYNNIYAKTLKNLVYDLKQKDITLTNLFLDKLYFNFFCYFIFLKIGFLTHIIDLTNLDNLFIINFDAILKKSKSNYNNTTNMFTNILSKRLSDSNMKLFSYIINYEKNNYSAITYFRTKGKYKTSNYDIYDISSYIINNIDYYSNKNTFQSSYNKLPLRYKVIKNDEIQIINQFFNNLKTQVNEKLDEDNPVDLSSYNLIINDNKFNIQPNKFNIQYIYIKNIIKNYIRPYNKLLNNKYSILFIDYLFINKFKKYIKNVKDKDYIKSLKEILSSDKLLLQYFNNSVLNKIKLQKYNSYVKRVFKCFWDTDNKYKLKSQFYNEYKSFNIFITNNNIPNKLNKSDILSKISRLNLENFKIKFSNFNFPQKNR